MNRLALHRLPSLRTVLFRAERHRTLPSRWTALSTVRALSTAGPPIPPSPDLPAPSAPSPTTGATTADTDLIRESIAGNVLHPTSSRNMSSTPGGGEVVSTDAVDPTLVADAASTVPTEQAPPIFSRFFGQSPATPPTDVTDTATTAADQASSTFSDMLLTPAMTVLNGVHDVTGLPWWLSIALATLSIRCLLLPFTVMTMRNSALMQALKDEIAIRRENVMEAARAGDRLAANARQTEMQTFMRNAGVAPMRVLLGPLVQFPVFISFFVSIRRLALSDPTMSTGGVAWFTDLSVMDPMYILPIACGASLLAMTEFGGDTGQTKMTPTLKMAMRGVAFLSVPMTGWFPAAVFCYWLPNNLISVSIGAAMRTSYLKKRFGLMVDPAQIPGTRAARQLEAKLALQGTGRVSHNQNIAAASYLRKGGDGVPSAQTVKPVLLKVRPKKKKKSGAQ